MVVALDGWPLRPWCLEVYFAGAEVRATTKLDFAGSLLPDPEGNLVT